MKISKSDALFHQGEDKLPDLIWAWQCQADKLKEQSKVADLLITQMWKPYQIYSTCGRAQSDLNEELFLFCGGGLNMQMHQNVESLNIWRLSVQTVESDKSFRVASSARSCRVNLDSLCFLSPNLKVFQKKVLQECLPIYKAFPKKVLRQGLCGGCRVTRYVSRVYQAITSLSRRMRRPLLDIFLFHKIEWYNKKFFCSITYIGFGKNRRTVEWGWNKFQAENCNKKETETTNKFQTLRMWFWRLTSRL